MCDLDHQQRDDCSLSNKSLLNSPEDSDSGMSTTRDSSTPTLIKQDGDDHLDAIKAAAASNYNKQSMMKAKKLREFYRGKNILITGATGFIGKVCLFKLMCSFEECGKIYVMLRPKKGMTPQQRFNRMLEEEPFSKFPPSVIDGRDNFGAQAVMRSSKADWSKVVALEGDMSCEDLGFAPEAKAKLCKEVDIIFNIAASVQFDAPLKQNLRDNYMGARNLMQLATKFEQLISFVHVSTFFTNSHLPHVQEKVLPMSRDCEKMADLIAWLPDSLCESIGPQIMENRPNTYIFTKAMAENLVQKYQGRLPIAIVRPSIVTPSVSEPVPGWVDNVNGPMGLGILASLGILRNIDWNYYGVGDFIPVDFVVNSMLTVAERTPRLYPNEIKVYNCSTSSLSPITWGRAFEHMRAESLKAPPYKMLRVPIYPPRHRRANPLGFRLTKMSEILFAYFVDFLLMLCGQKQLLTRLTSKLHHGYEILKPFTTNEYTCSNENLVAAYDELHDEDKKDLNFDVTSVDWTSYFKQSYYGARRRLLKEDVSNVPAALFKLRLHQAVELIFSLLFYGFVIWTSYRLYGYFSRHVLLSL